MLIYLNKSIFITKWLHLSIYSRKTDYSGGVLKLFSVCLYASCVRENLYTNFIRIIIPSSTDN